MKPELMDALVFHVLRGACVSMVLTVFALGAMVVLMVIGELLDWWQA
jgi:hypothetical protein